MPDPTIQDWLGNFYSVYNLAGATFQDHFGTIFTLAGPTSGLRAGGAGGGRLTITTGTPVLTANTTGSTSIFYTPYVSDIVSIYNGTSFVPYTFSELTNLTAQSSTGSAGPAAVANNSVYDLFVWLNGSTVTLTRGPAWTNTTTRSAGTALTRLKGPLVNSVAITNGPGVTLGTYVGTVASNGSAAVEWLTGAVSAGWTAGSYGVWNMYNRVDVSSSNGDTGNWSYNSATVRAPNGNTTAARTTFVRGQDEDIVHAHYSSYIASTDGSHTTSVGVALDATNAFSGFAANISLTTGGVIVGFYSGLPGVGQHFINAAEASPQTGTQLIFGNAFTNVQTGMVVRFRA